MVSHSRFEAFQPYHRFLGQTTLWPSESTGEMVAIDGMVPRHAASALQKLVRWSRTTTAYAHINHSDPNGRETAVRNSMLGKALAARAQGLDPDEDPDDRKEAVPDSSLVLSIALALNTAVPGLTTYTVVDASRKIARSIEAEWTVTIKSR